ncbi:autotransporter-like protein [Cricetibacter osteomyelitidis]|uniref:Autotransporter-like protein n=1 Tax=Cricetibacter osteomyelitidis TaxID=1521931 RepID=A0A4V6NS88_9PAST|nr:autotransporter outer membrane beta-barrel domain-containing protein [Cricetibacter osteomyelitidis]TCP96183.1 autotransporter-like protein [Cricetibacter osteomyelitidis]
MNNHNNAFLKSLTLTAVILTTISISANAYQRSEGSIAIVNEEDNVEKIDTITSDSTEERITGKFNRSGNPVRIIWYGNPNDSDGKVAQLAAKNAGQIAGGVIAIGKTTTESEDRRGAISIDGIANGFDALGWSAPSNPANVIFSLENIENSGTISARASLQGGKAETHGDVKSYGSSNGISIVGLADFGKHTAEVGADGIADGYSGATSVSRVRVSRSATRSRAVTVEESTPSTPELEKADFEGKTVEVSLQKFKNSGQIHANIQAQAEQNTIAHTSSYKPQFYSVTTSASGNAVSAASYVNTIDKLTFSEQQNNFAKLGDIENSGSLNGNAMLKGGQNTTHTTTHSTNTGNGISALAHTGRFAKNKTESAVGNIQNTGQINGTLEQISGNNSNYQGFHLYSDANALGSGNGVSVTADSSNGQTRYLSSSATIGDVQNSGYIRGTAIVHAGNGMGSLMAKAVSSGNGLSTYSQGNNGQLSAIGNIDNSGIISGQIEVKGGRSGDNSRDKIFIPKIEQTSANNNLFGNDGMNNWLAPSSKPIAATSPKLSEETCKWLAAGTPGCEKEKPKADDTPNHVKATVQTSTTVHSSGNGITAWSYLESAPGDYATKNSRLGNISNTGVISGYAKVLQGFSQNQFTPVDYRNNGAGIAINSETNANITNAGIISGNHSALLSRGKIDTSWSIRNPEYRSGFKGNIYNYGILAGRLIIGNYELDNNSGQYYRYFDTSDKTNSKVKNAGLYVKLDENEAIDKIIVGNDKPDNFVQNGKTYTIENAPLTTNGKDSEKVTNQAETITNKIINGVGMANGALFAKHNLTLTDSIVNGYKTALKIAENSEVNLNGAILNVNGFKNNQIDKPLAVKGDMGTNKLIIANKSNINGDIDLKAGDDQLTISDSHSRFNGRTIDLGEGNDTLAFGQENNPLTTPIKVDYHIANAENILINQPTELQANAAVRGTDSITLNQDLHYQVLSPNQHALFDKARNKSISLTGKGKFVVDTTKATSEYEVNFGGFQLQPTDIKFATNNVLQSAIFKDGKLLIQPKTVITQEETGQHATSEQQFQTPYAEAYNSYIDSWRVNGINPLENSASTDNKSAKAASEAINRYLADTVEHNLYAAILPQLAHNMAVKRDALLSENKRLNAQEWMVSAQVLSRRNDYHESARKGKTHTSMLAIHYGINNDITTGAHISTNKTQIEGYQSSYLKGNGIAFGGYIRSRFERLTLTGGVIHEQFNLKGKRTISNSYNSHQFDANGKANATGIYTQLKYALPLGEQWQLVPKFAVAYSRFNQKAINEIGVAGLTIDAQHSNRLEGIIGQELIANIPTLNGNAVFKFSGDYSVISAEKDLHSHFRNGRTFKIRSEPTRHVTHVGLGVGYQWKIGVDLYLNAHKAFSKTGDQTSMNLKIGYTFK